MACSTPPMYWSMGNQYCTMAGVERGLGILRVGVAVEVPTGIDEGIHRVGFAPRRSAAFWAGGIHKLRDAPERRTALLRDFDFVGQNHRQLIVGHWNKRRRVRSESWGSAYPNSVGGLRPNPSSER